MGTTTFIVWPVNAMVYDVASVVHLINIENKYILGDP
jgi:hypothetical protein